MEGALSRLGPELTETLTEDVYRRMHDLPSRAEEAELRAQEERGALGEEGGAAEETDGETVVGSDTGVEEARGVAGTGPKREPEGGMAGGNKLKRAWSRANVKGPRGLKLWGLGKLFSA